MRFDLRSVSTISTYSTLSPWQQLLQGQAPFTFSLKPKIKLAYIIFLAHAPLVMSAEKPFQRRRELLHFDEIFDERL